MDMNQKSLRPEAKESRAALVPAVDIWENAEGIVVNADLPGVAKENLSIGIEGDTLTIEGTVTLGESAKMQDVYAEVRVAQYRRSFVLGTDLDKEKVSANLVNGVLELRIPKAEAAKPRRIPIAAG
jgi:HSP20 family molecular chaperone IbpA